MNLNELTPHLFRTEYSKIVAVLCHSFHLRHVEIAEDIASETFLKATETWSINGAPDNPTAWLYAVAKNKARDYCKHRSVHEKHANDVGESEIIFTELDFEFDQQKITDSQLAMIFAVCGPDISPEAQISLALQILCGFSVEEIANAFLTKTETIKKRLLRARAALREDKFQIMVLNESEIQSRQVTVLRALYLLFNEGYFSGTGDQVIRKDLCSEAIRLTLILTESPLTNTPATSALLALMCFQSSRLDARTDEQGETILFEDQDRALWNEELIERGNHYLALSTSGSEISKYHLEAGIAFWHTQPPDDSKWKNILHLYNQLILIEYSPVTALNRTFAFAKVYGNKEAITETEKLKLNDSGLYHSLLGYLYADTDVQEAIRHYEQAIALSKAKNERKALEKEVRRLSAFASKSISQ